MKLPFKYREMKEVIVCVLLVAASLLGVAQERKHEVSLIGSDARQTTRVETNIYFGVQQNFFVDYDRAVKESEGYLQPIEEIGYDFFQKNSIGIIYGATAFFVFNEKNKIGVDFNRTENTGRYNFSYTGPTNYEVHINNMKLKHINNSISVIYKRKDIINSNSRFTQK